MTDKKLKVTVSVLNIAVFIFIMLFQATGAISLSVKTATPLLFLPMLTAYASFGELKRTVLLSFFAGTVMDSVTARTYCFNTLIFIFIGVAVYLAANNIFNKNIKGVAVMALLTALLYFIVKWLVYFAFGVSINNSILYLLKYALPSAVYSAVFIIPFFYLYKHFSKLLA